MDKTEQWFLAMKFTSRTENNPKSLANGVYLKVDRIRPREDKNRILSLSRQKPAHITFLEQSLWHVSFELGCCSTPERKDIHNKYYIRGIRG